jgi:hypothetical protein
MLIQKNAALRAFIGVIPGPDPVQRGLRTLHSETHPAKAAHACIRQPIEHRLERGRVGQVSRAVLVIEAQADSRAGSICREADSCYGVVQFLAILAEDRLDEYIQPTVGTTGDLGPVATVGTLKQVRPTHALLE